MTQNSPSGYVRTLQQVEIDLEALRLRSEGWTFRKIGEAMGCTDEAARLRYRRALESVPYEAVDSHRKEMREQIDTLLEVAFEQAVGAKRSLFAIDRCVVLMDRKARLLGLDAPMKHEIITLDYIQSEILRLEAEVTRDDARATLGELTETSGA